MPRAQWQDIALKKEEREAIVRSMSVHDQALLAFYSGEDQKVVTLLSGITPEKATLEDAFLLAWSYDPLGVADCRKSEEWFNHIVERHPDTPWARAAQKSIKANRTLLTKYDKNQNQQLDLIERDEMQANENFNARKGSEEYIKVHIRRLFTLCDKSGDQRLDAYEMQQFIAGIPPQFNFPGMGMARETRWDTNKDSYVDPAELELLIKELSRWKMMRFGK